MIRNKSLRGVAMAMEVCALWGRWGIGLVHQGYGQKAAEPTRPWGGKNLNWAVPLK